MEEALHNLSSGNVYLLFVLFCRFHEKIWPQLVGKYRNLVFLFIFDFI